MTDSTAPGGLLGRRAECRALDDLLGQVRNGTSAALVVRGEAGIGKTALLRYLETRAGDCHVVHASGVESEMEMSYASLHQLCSPLITGLDRLPEPQHDALASAFGLRNGDVPDRFLVGLAALSLLANAAEERPLVCVIDDAQWLDQASALTLGFVGRRLLAEAVLLVFAVRDPWQLEALDGLPELIVPGLADRESEVLLDSVVLGRLDHRVRDRILSEARGNPLALLELPRGLTAPDPAGSFPAHERRSASNQVEQEFAHRVTSLPVGARRVLATAAADPLGDVSLLRSAAARLGLDVDAAVSHPEVTPLMTVGTQVQFRHPLVRSAAYHSAPLAERQEVHRALAESMDADTDPDRRAWHRAQATSGPDEDVASELERSAIRARSRGGVAAMAAFLARAAELTRDPRHRSQRSLAAAQAKARAGAFDEAAALLAVAEAGAPGDLERAQLDRLHSEIALAQGRGLQATPLLVAAAQRLEGIDAVMARETHLDALTAAIFAGHFAVDPSPSEVAHAARRAPTSADPREADLLLEALAVRLTDGFVPYAPLADRMLTAFCSDRLDVEQSSRWSLLAGIVAADLWDLERWHTIATRLGDLTREAGALSGLPLALDSRAVTHVFAGDLATAAAVVDEVRTVSEAIGTIQPPFGAMALAAVRGREPEARPLIEAVIAGSTAYGQGLGVTVASYHLAVLCNGLSDLDGAEAAARTSAEQQESFGAPHWALAELVEAAVRNDAPGRAFEALDRLTPIARASGTDWALGVEARTRALLTDGPAAEDLYREAVERLSRTSVRVQLARSHLLYGEWLRRSDRRADAREQLGVAHEMLTDIGAEAFAERAGRELRASGTSVRSRPVEVSTPLTTQEEQIARLAGEGLTNPEIGARLLLSPHTVEWHLRKVFAKLGISSRRDISKAIVAISAP